MQHDIRWTAEKIAGRLRLLAPLVHRRRVALAPFRYRLLSGPQAPDYAGPEVADGDWPWLKAGDFWGEAERDFVLRGSFRLPPAWQATSDAALFLPIGEAPDFIHPEAMVYVDGRPYAAVDRFHQEVPLAPAWYDGREHRLALRGFAGLWQDEQSGRPLPVRLRLGPVAVVQVDQPLRAFLATARVALEAAQALAPDHPTRWLLLDGLDRAFRLLDTREPLGDAFYESVPPAHKLLQQRLREAGPPHPATITATGHAHLDLAWLWTLAQARRKAARTFYNVLRLMERFPAYHFTQSQPQLYEYIRQDHPALFKAIQERAAEGRWEPLGGMWVEADCNISGPESLARQFLLGQRFLRDHFGEAVSPILWLPDVFGYAWNLPQLIRQAGLDYFFTIKIGWSQYNRLPYDSFWWQGLDGTRVLTHFSTTPEPGSYSQHGTYNAFLGAEAALESWRNFQQKDVQRELLMSFGFGDGGGGPTAEMLENMGELAAFPAIPQVRAGSAASFFRRLEAEAGERLPVWNGELYLELHRGTYTSQSRNKRANRKSEFLLHDAEFAATLASQLDPDYRYPQAALRRAWELVCLNQFHDIIPGSSIGAVYEESLQQYEEVRALAEGARQEALQSVAGVVAGDWLLLNPTPFTRHDPVMLPTSLVEEKGLQDGAGRALPSQPASGGTLVDAGPLPPYSITPLWQTTDATAAAPATTNGPLLASPTRLENNLLRVELNGAGDIVRLHDKREGRELLPAGAVANQFQAFEDRPLSWDAWDVDIFYDDKQWLAEPAEAVRVVEAGPLRATLQIRRRILNSTYVQRISLMRQSAALRFDTTITWRERHILLKVAFPLQILAPWATYEIQWGNVQRPTHRNTSWDWARFESCAQKWVDLSEGDYGVSLLNDCKYGHDIHDNVIRLSLLRGPTHPDPQADQGEHHFSYSLLPHTGSVGAATIASAYALNDPVLVARGGQGTQPAPPGLVAVDRPNVVLETVKRAEDGQGIIVRLYEALRQRGPVRLHTAFPLEEALVTNLLEEEERRLPVAGNEVTFEIRPFQIMTLRLLPARDQTPRPVDETRRKG